MNDYILLIHDDAQSEPGDWTDYFESLRATGRFDGGSSISPTGLCARKDTTTRPIASHIVGYLRVRADDVADAERFLIGNPVYEAGGTIEIRELPRD